MGTQAEHRVKWAHNREFLGTIEEKYCDWMVTAAFYAAVHAVETLFAFDGVGNHTSHMDRNQTLKTINRYRKIWQHFRPLWGAAQTSRYECTSTSWIPVEDVKRRLVGVHLYGVEASVLKLTKSADSLDQIEWIS